MIFDECNRFKRCGVRLTALTLAASMAVATTQAEALTNKQKFQTSVLGAMGWTAAYSISSVLSRVQTTDWWGFGIGLVAAAACSVPAAGFSWFSKPEWFGGAWHSAVNPEQWTGAGMFTVAFKFFAVGFPAGGCAWGARGMYNYERGWQWSGSAMHEPVKNIACDPKEFKCERLQPAPSPAKRRLLAAAVVAQNTTSMNREYEEFHAAKADYAHIVSYSQLRDDACRAAHDRDTFNRCRHDYSVLISNANRAMTNQAQNFMNEQTALGIAARKYIRGFGYTRFPANGTIAHT